MPDWGDINDWQELIKWDYDPGGGPVTRTLNTAIDVRIFSASVEPPSTSAFCYTDEGVFLVDEWAISEDTTTATITGRDGSKLLQDYEMVPIAYRNQKLDRVIKDIAQRAGVVNLNIATSTLTEEELSTGVTEEQLDTDEVVEIQKGNIVWSQNQTPWAFLQQVANADLGVFYFDDSGVLQYQSKESIADFDTSTPTHTLTPDDNIISGGYKTELVKNAISLTYVKPELSKTTVSLWDLTDETVLSSTSLAVQCTSGDKTIVVGDISDWQQQGYFKLDDEIIKYNSRTDNSFDDCERGWLGTTPASHYPTFTNDKWTFSPTAAWSISGGVLQTYDETYENGTGELIPDAGWVYALSDGNTFNTSSFNDDITFTGYARVQAYPWKIAVIIPADTADPQDNHYRFVIKTKAMPGEIKGTSDADVYVLQEVRNGNVTTLKSITNPKKTVFSGNRFKFAVQYEGNDLSLFINNTRVLHYEIDTETDEDDGDPGVDLQIDQPFRIGVAARGRGPTTFDSFSVEGLPDSGQPGALLMKESFGKVIYEIRRFDMEYTEFPAFGVQYALSEPDEVEVVSFIPEAFKATAYVRNRIDGLTMLAGTPPGDDQLPRFFYVYGQAVENTNESQTIELENTESISKYGRQELAVSLPWVQSESHAKILAQYLLDIYKEPVKLITTNISVIPNAKIGNIVSYSYPRLGINEEYVITNISMDLGENGNINQTLTLRNHVRIPLAPYLGEQNNAVACPIENPDEDFWVGGGIQQSMPLVTTGYTEQIYTETTSPVISTDSLRIPIRVWRPSTDAPTNVTDGIPDPLPPSLSSSGARNTIIWAHEGWPVSKDEVSNYSEIRRWLIKILRWGAKRHNVVFVDYRGSGGHSADYFNAHDALHSDLDDLKAVRDWVVGQSFSNGETVLMGYKYGATMALYSTLAYPTSYNGFVSICGTPNIGCSMQKNEYSDFRVDRIAKGFGGTPNEGAADYISTSPAYQTADITNNPIFMIAAENDSYASIEDVYHFYNAANDSGKNIEVAAYEGEVGGWLFGMDADDRNAGFRTDPWKRVVKFLSTI